jgi:head-tail adaptor
MSRPGKLKRQLEIKRPNVVPDSMGGATGSYSSLGLFWCSVTRVGGSRGLEYEQTAHQRPFRIVLRQDIDILENDTIEFDGQNLTVASVERDFDKKRFQTLIATSKFAG